MTRSIAKTSKSLLLKIIVGILILPFLFWGMGDIFRGGNQNIVATIDKEKIHSQEFVNFLNRLNLSDQEIIEIKNGTLIQKILSEYIGKKIIDLEIDYYNIVISDKSLKEIIVNDETFFKDGKFSRTEYEKFLISNNITAPILENNILEQEKKRQLLSYLSDGVIIPDFLTEYEFNKKNQIKRIKYIDLDNMYKNKKFSEDEIIETYEKNKKFYIEKKKNFLVSEITPKNLGYENNETQYFKKLDEIENNVLDGKNLKMITDENKLPIENINNFTPSDVANQSTKDKKELYSKLISFDNEKETQFLKIGEKFFVVELNKININQKKITDKEVRDSILSQLNLVYKLQSNTDIAKKINENNKNFLEDFSKKNNLQIKDLELSSSKNQNIFDKNVLKRIFEIRDSEIALITDNSFKKNFIVFSLNTKFMKIDSKIPNYEKLKATTKLNTAQQIFNLYDKNLNKKYNIEVNQKVLDRIKNSF
tara:strand:- start:2681 stop:4117 length:1437 start_codon:yes stop_codon:yes gene_type:complete